jgi:hypothetical protein
MKKIPLLFLGSVLLISLFAAGAAAAAPTQGMLVDKNGDPTEGYSNVWIVDGMPQPVYNPATHLWYSLFIIGTGENGVVICALGPPLGTRGDYEGGFEPHEHVRIQTF